MTQHNASTTTTNARTISATHLNALMSSDYVYALIDVREAGEYNSSHIPASSLISRRDLEIQMAGSVHHKGIHIIVCDDDGRRAD